MQNIEIMIDEYDGILIFARPYATFTVQCFVP